jgi:hypothetical protein
LKFLSFTVDCGYDQIFEENAIVFHATTSLLPLFDVWVICLFSVLDILSMAFIARVLSVM